MATWIDLMEVIATKEPKAEDMRYFVAPYGWDGGCPYWGDFVDYALYNGGAEGYMKGWGHNNLFFPSKKSYQDFLNMSPSIRVWISCPLMEIQPDAEIHLYSNRLATPEAKKWLKSMRKPEPKRKPHQDKRYTVYYKSRYYPLEGTHRTTVYAPNKKWIRDNWHSIMETDEYTIIRSEEIKE